MDFLAGLKENKELVAAVCGVIAALIGLATVVIGKRRVVIHKTEFGHNVAEPAKEWSDTGKPSRWLVGAVLAGIVLAVGAWFILVNHGSTTAHTPDVAQPSNPPANPISPAVVPTGDPSAEPKTVAKSTTPTSQASVPTVADPKPGATRQVEIAPGVSMTFCWVPAGECQLGSPQSENDARLTELGNMIDNKNKQGFFLVESEERRGKFRTPGFWMGKYEVTQVEWYAVMKGVMVKNEDISRPSSFRSGGSMASNLDGIMDTSRFPVDSVSWDDCQLFLDRANTHGNILKVFERPGKFILPHEDQWEYACRGGKGNNQAFHWGNELNGTQARCDGSLPFGTTQAGPSLRRTMSIGSFEKEFPHPWGLCDMHGNVDEWCDNTYEQTIYRVRRGGSWNSRANFCRAASRTWINSDNRHGYFGFRLCLSWT